MSSWTSPQADTERLVAIEGELIRLVPGSSPGPRRRLLGATLSAGAERIPVRVTSLSPRGCDAAGPQSIADVDGKLWLRLPGFEPFQIAAIDETEGRLQCLFAQPLSSAVLKALAQPRAPMPRPTAIKPRCTLL